MTDLSLLRVRCPLSALSRHRPWVKCGIAGARPCHVCRRGPWVGPQSRPSSAGTLRLEGEGVPRARVSGHTGVEVRGRRNNA